MLSKGLGHFYNLLMNVANKKDVKYVANPLAEQKPPHW